MILRMSCSEVSSLRFTFSNCASFDTPAFSCVGSFSKLCGWSCVCCSQGNNCIHELTHTHTHTNRHVGDGKDSC